MSGELVLWTATVRCQHCEWTDTVSRLNKQEVGRAGSVLLVAHHDMCHPDCDKHDFGLNDRGVVG